MRNALGSTLAFGLLLVSGCSDPRPGGDAGPTPPDGTAACSTDSDCDDATYCNGAERCVSSTCVAGSPACSEGQRCSEVGDLCYTDCTVTSDADRDGIGAVECGGVDCDDSDVAVRPGASERCDGRDEDCDERVDEECSMPEDAGRDGGRDAGRDAGPDAAVDLCDHSAPGLVVGAPCAGVECTGMVCQPELTTTTMEGHEVRAFPAGMCGDPCDPSAGVDACGTCGTCNPAVLAGRVRYAIDEPGSGVCRADCVPTRGDRGGCDRAPYACDVSTGTCMEACIDDAQCRYVLAADGTVVDDPTSPWFCDGASGRCTHAGVSTARAGDTCTSDAQCMGDGVCLGGPWGGYCVSFGCEWPAFACRAGESCDHVRAPSGVCLDACRVGGEPESERFGSAGHGLGCALGFSCAWDGSSALTDDPNGSCIPGNYNAVTTSNVGAPCTTDAECYSPFGYGRCMFASDPALPSGICTIDQCFHSPSTDARGILPEIEVAGVCDGASELCVDLAASGEPPATVCLESCTSAASCAPGYACAAILTGPTSVCWPACTSSAECRAGETCRGSSGAACAPGEQCSCEI